MTDLDIQVAEYPKDAKEGESERTEYTVEATFITPTGSQVPLWDPMDWWAFAIQQVQSYRRVTKKAVPSMATIDYMVRSIDAKTATVTVVVKEVYVGSHVA